MILAIWGMETGFGANSGNKAVFQPLATLAYDCRRSDFFTNELNSALEIAHKGYIPAGQMKGAGFGELGQTQFLPSKYLQFAVDFDGDGRRDLIRSRADVLASTANFLRGHGWSSGGGYGPGEANYGVWNSWNRATRLPEGVGGIFAAHRQLGSDVLSCFRTRRPSPGCRLQAHAAMRLFRRCDVEIVGTAGQRLAGMRIDVRYVERDVHCDAQRLRLRAASVRSRSALSRMKPSASFWS